MYVRPRLRFLLPSEGSSGSLGSAYARSAIFSRLLIFRRYRLSQAALGVQPIAIIGQYVAQPYEKRAGSAESVTDLFFDRAPRRRVEVDAVRELILGDFGVTVEAQPGCERVVCDPAKKVVLLEEAPIHLDQPPRQRW